MTEPAPQQADEQAQQLELPGAAAPDAHDHQSASDAGEVEHHIGAESLKLPRDDSADGQLASAADHGSDADGSEDDDGEEDEDSDEEDEEEEDDDDEDVDEEDSDEEEEEDEEPQLKSTRLTQHLGAVYRNGDATSASLVAGDKMILGTHNGNIHVIQLPAFNPLRVYHAHSASVTSISISPYPPPLPNEKNEAPQQTQPTQARPATRQAEASPKSATRKAREITQVPRTPSNDIYIATSSMDGNVCVQSLLDMKDVQLRNFARPVQAVALSPEYKTDRTYLSGGLAGQLILTVGGSPGRSTSTTVASAAAVASDWLSTLGVKSNGGKDTVLHSGEGTINVIKWSLSGKYVVWLNEHGIKIMRSKLHLETAEAEDAWKRLGHIDRPQTSQWETMASVWKGRVEWIDEKAVENDELGQSQLDDGAEQLSEQMIISKKNIERLLVGWGGTMWIIHVHPGGVGTGRNIGERTVGRAEIVKILHTDCIISGISLYTQNQLLVLALGSADNEEDDAEDNDRFSSTNMPETPTKRKGKAHTISGVEATGDSRRRLSTQPPELRLIDLKSQVESDRHTLAISRFERLSAVDYHMNFLPAQNAASVVASSKSTLEALAGLGSEMWNVAINPKSLFSSGASVISKESGEDNASGSKSGTKIDAIRGTPNRSKIQTVHPSLSKPGSKIFIHSPYDCVVGSKRDLSDHLAWLLERDQYQRAWELLDENPEILASSIENSADYGPSTPSKHHGAVDDFYDDESMADVTQQNMYSSVEKEKRRIGELWIRELIDEGDWATAGQVCGKVLTTPDRWEKWVWTFAGSKKFDEITKYIPSKPMQPPLPRAIYEVVLGHYMQSDKPRFQKLLEEWPTDLFDIPAITTALENQLSYRDVRENTVEDGERGRDWRIVMEGLAKLYEAGGRHRDALRCYIKLQDADSAFRLIGDFHLAGAVVDDIPGFIGLRVPSERQNHMTERELVVATSEAITLLVEEAQHGLVRPEVVVEQLQAKNLHLYLFFYLKGLWRGEGIMEHSSENLDRLVIESQSLVDNFADLAVHLFATFERHLLMDYLKISTSYGFEKAVEECEAFSYYDELVYLYSKTGQMKRALYLIIDRLNNVNKAIEFAKEQDDPDLWEDLLTYSMDKPNFIRALLEQVGTTINPITLIRRIPEGLEIHGLREGLIHMMKEHELQHSISSGVATVLRSEVVAAQNELRAGQRRGIKFDLAADEAKKPEETENNDMAPRPGHCAKCLEPFVEYEMETLLGFACGHVFHVSHLLEMLHGGRKVDIDFVQRGEEEEGRYMVGMKVMKARLLRDKVRGGCPICHPPKT